MVKVSSVKKMSTVNAIPVRGEHYGEHKAGQRQEGNPLNPEV